MDFLIKVNKTTSKCQRRPKKNRNTGCENRSFKLLVRVAEESSPKQPTSILLHCAPEVECKSIAGHHICQAQSSEAPELALN